MEEGQQVWTSVAVVVRSQPSLAALRHIASTIHTFVDVTARWNLVRAVKTESLPLLELVDARQSREWQSLPHWLQQCKRQRQFAQAMNAAAERGWVPGMQWLRDVYFPEGKVMSIGLTAALAGHARAFTWIFDAYPSECMIISGGLSESIAKGNVDVVQVFYEKHWTMFMSLHDRGTHIYDSGHLPMFQWLQRHWQGFNRQRAMQDAAMLGHQHIVQWLHDHCNQQFTDEVVHKAVASGHLPLLQYLHEYQHECTWATHDLMDIAASYGHVETLQWLHTQCTEPYEEVCWVNTHIMYQTEKVQSSRGYWDVCKWLHINGHASIPADFIQIAAVKGNLPMLQWLFDNYRSVIEQHAAKPYIDHAIFNCSPDVMEWLYARGFRFSCVALKLAASHGMFSMVEWLHSKYPEYTTNPAMNAAAEAGHLEVVKFLHEHQTGVYTPKAMDLAAANNHLEVVQFLHEYRTEGCTTDAMDLSVSVEMLEFLHRNRSEGCTSRVSWMAAKRGKLSVLRWVYEHKRMMIDWGSVAINASRSHQYHIRHWIIAMLEEEKQGAQ